MHHVSSPCKNLHFALPVRTDGVPLQGDRPYGGHAQDQGCDDLSFCHRGVVNSFVPRVTGELRIALDELPPRAVPPLELKGEQGEGMKGEELQGLTEEITDEGAPGHQDPAEDHLDPTQEPRTISVRASKSS